MKRKLLVATHNRGKVAEYADMLAEFEVEWLTLSDVGVTMDVEETGDSFLANGRLKAISYARETGLLTLAEDSGLEVDALNGEPGIYTARYGGEGLSHEERYRFLLNNMEDTLNRAARFRCVIVLCDENGREIGHSDGVCEGAIAYEPMGDGGFGYDPVFYLPERNKTMAQLPAATKHKISHRGQALKNIMPLLRDWLANE